MTGQEIIELVKVIGGTICFLGFLYFAYRLYMD